MFYEVADDDDPREAAPLMGSTGIDYSNHAYDRPAQQASAPNGFDRVAASLLVGTSHDASTPTAGTGSGNAALNTLNGGGDATSIYTPSHHSTYSYERERDRSGVRIEFSSATDAAAAAAEAAAAAANGSGSVLKIGGRALGGTRGFRGIKQIPIRPVSRFIAGLWMAVPVCFNPTRSATAAADRSSYRTRTQLQGTWLVWNVVLILIAVVGLLRSAAAHSAAVSAADAATAAAAATASAAAAAGAAAVAGTTASLDAAAVSASAAAAAVEWCTAHDSVASFLRVSIFHSCCAASLITLYLYRLWQQITATHLHIQTSLPTKDISLVAVGSSGGGGGGDRDAATQKAVSIALPLPFVFRESWTDVVIEYLLVCSVAGGALVACWGEAAIGGVGVFGGPLSTANAECQLTAPILFAAAATVSFAYSCISGLIAVAGLRQSLDTLILRYCQ